MHRFTFFSLLLIFLALPGKADAHATTMAVKVVDVSSTDEGYLLKLDPQNNEHLPKQIVIHLRFNPKKAAFAASHSREDFESALEALKGAAAKKKPILIGLMSNKGFNPIKGRPGHFRSEMIQRVDWFKEPGVVCFFHSDHYEEAPK